MLTMVQKQVYVTLMKSIGSQAIPCDAAVSDIHAAIKALLMDHPKLCFFEGKWRYDHGIIYPQHVLPVQSALQLTETARKISELFSDESYPRQIYDWMLSRIQYCPDAVNSQNAYGALIQRRAVCKGIAKGYQLLMEARNIDCILVEGTLDGQMKHAWNMIRYEGQWKHVDVTMGYPCFWSLTGAKDTWGGYNKTTAELSRSHKLYHPEVLPRER